ncbi:hypothetical protein I4F81_003060 [Pyropia yezoensis]|uniref:Uncharacterized protein n=1 Tax=Pyropia yezoensis TaxID=2788 RepID=A0ACC3BRY8_PYRYE|nr:hypothetical protein I4F81_003060 [Neopyropia yezoensis]
MGAPGGASPRRAGGLALLLLSAAALVTVAPSTGTAYKVPAGNTCNCVQTSSAGRCLLNVRFDPSTGAYECARSADGAGCSPPWDCVDTGATHVCLASRTEPSFQCTAPSSGGTCPCARSGAAGVSLTPQSARPGGTAPRSGGGGGGKKQKPRTGSTKKAVWLPAGPAPAPQEPTCRSKYVGVFVGADKWRCVASMKIGKRSVAEAYNYKKATQSGWATEDDMLSMVFLRDAGSRLYFCMTYGAPTLSGSGTRKTIAQLTTAGPNTWYVRDDPGDKYANKTTASGGTVLTAINRWKDSYTDGFCTAMGNKMVADFSALEYVIGMAVPESSTPTAYPKTGPWTAWKLATAPKTSALAYDSGGRILPAKAQAKAWKEAGKKGKPPPSAIRKVKFQARCSCKNF